MDTRLRTAVKATRQRLGMQQQELAEAIGVSRQTLSLIEAGETVPSTQIALTLSRELRCRVEDLFSLRSDGQVIEAELVGETNPSAQDARKRRVSLGWVEDRWVAADQTRLPGYEVLYRPGQDGAEYQLRLQVAR